MALLAIGSNASTKSSSRFSSAADKPARATLTPMMFATLPSGSAASRARLIKRNAAVFSFSRSAFTRCKVETVSAVSHATPLSSPAIGQCVRQISSILFRSALEITDDGGRGGGVALRRLSIRVCWTIPTMNAGSATNAMTSCPMTSPSRSAFTDEPRMKAAATIVAKAPITTKLTIA